MSDNLEPTPDDSQPSANEPAKPTNEAGETASPSETPAGDATQPAPESPADSASSGESTDGAGQLNKFGIQVGRRADATGPKPRSKPAPIGGAVGAIDKVDALERPPLPKKPSRRDALPEELEAEINAALGEMSLDQIVSKGGLEGEELEIDSKRRATVLRVDQENIFFALDGRHEGVVAARHFEKPPEIGTAHDVVVTGYNSEDGLYDLLIPGASIDVGDWSDIADGSLVEARITGHNTGGLECQVAKLRGFIPASQISLYRTENLAEFVDQKMVCVVTESNPERRNLVLSRRAVLEREREEAKQQLLGELAPGQMREGIVRNIRDFGAFVDLGGVDGLIHISQLSWDRVNHPSDVVEEGQTVKVKIEKIDPETGKIGLSLRDSTQHPWASAQQQFPIGTVVTGQVSKIANFGAFVKLAPGIEGLVHISEIAHQRVQSVGTYLKEGQAVEVKILEVDFDKQRIALSIKQTQQAPSSGKDKAEEEQPPAERMLKASNKPLKGGTDRPSGGEHFGLKW